MKISKYLHSCLVFELDGYKLLFDPGQFSFADGRVTADMFADVKSIVFTHIHADHFDIDILRNILSITPAEVYANSQIGKELDKAGIPFHLVGSSKFNIGPFELIPIAITHEPLLNNPPPEMTGYVINEKVLHPVDSLSHEMDTYKGIELLLMVTMAPFASEVAIAEFTDRIQPKQILPVHDGYAHEFFVKQRHANYKKYFAEKGIRFHAITAIGDGIAL